MKEKQLWTCELCNTDYNSKRKAQECEENHKTKFVRIDFKHKPINILPDGFPNRIILEDKDGKRIEYKR